MFYFAVALSNHHRIDEIIEAGLPAPAINQLELSPFNQHKDVIQWATDHDMEISCAAWSKLSSGT